MLQNENTVAKILIVGVTGQQSLKCFCMGGIIRVTIQSLKQYIQDQTLLM